MIIFITELVETMEKHSRPIKFARFHIVTHCYTLLLQKPIIQQITITFLVSGKTFLQPKFDDEIEKLRE